MRRKKNETDPLLIFKELESEKKKKAERKMREEMRDAFLNLKSLIESSSSSHGTRRLASFLRKNKSVKKVINELSSKGATLLEIACRTRKVEVVDLVLDAGANVNALNSEGISALTICFAMGYESIATLLSERGGQMIGKAPRLEFLRLSYEDEQKHK